jgi:hypothetical protein
LKRALFAIVTLCLLVFALLATGCGLPTGDVVRYDLDSPELANASVEEGVWESAPWEGTEWIPFTGRLTIELEHTLGRTPRGVLVYLAFDPDGTDPGLAAGDLGRTIHADEEIVAVMNDTNATYFTRVVAF